MKRYRVSSCPLVQLLSHVRLSATPWTAACLASLSFTISWSLLKFMSFESVMPFKHLILCHPLLLSLIFSNIRVFSNEWALHIRWPKYRSFNFSISPSNEYSGLISFRIGWPDLLLSKGCSRVFSNTTVRKHQFFTALSLLYGPILTSVCDYWKNHSLDYIDFCQQSDIFDF